MEPYVIICRSCTARLKVTNEALIGQRLACPKCQEMIDVIAPDGYQPKPNPTDSEKDAGSESAISGNFEDIESLLANAQQEKNVQRSKRQPKSKQKPEPNLKAKPKAKLKAKHKPKLSPLAPAQTNGGTTRPKRSNSDTSPTTKSISQQLPEERSTLPTSHLDSEAARRKKRVLRIVMLALLATIAIGIGVWSMISGGSPNEPLDTIANKDTALNSSPSNPPPSDQTLSDADPTALGSANLLTGEPTVDKDEKIKGLNETDSAPSTRPPSNLSDLKPPTVVDNSASQSAPPPLDVGTPSDVTDLASSDLGNAGANNSDLGNSDLGNAGAVDSRPKKPADPNGDAMTFLPVTESTDETANTKDTSPLIPSTENSLGQLSEILKGQGTSLKKIEDIAEIQKERALIGTPTYLIERPNRKELNTERQLAAELSGWKLNKVPLMDAIRDLEMLCDVPVTIAPELFVDGEFDITKPITLKVEAINFKSAFEKLLVADQLTLLPTSAGVKIAATEKNEVTTKSYPQNFCDNEKSTQRLKDLIIAVTGITDWNDDDKYNLEILTDSVSVSHRENEQQQIADLLKKLNIAANYKSDPAAMNADLLPLALKADSVLASSPEFKTNNPYRHSMRIGSLFRQVRQTTNMTTIIDWENLSQQGWYPNTIMPGRIDEPTNQNLLDQLGHSMEVTTVVVGPNTVMLTTFENAGRRNDIEVYSVGDVIDNRMTAPQLDRLLTETLGVDQLTPPNAVVIYFAECKCLVAKAPQIVQRQLHSIVGEL